MTRDNVHTNRFRRCSLLGVGIAVFLSLTTLATGDDGREDYLAVTTLQVGAIYDASEFQIRFVFPTENPSWYHQYWVYEDGHWVRYGSGADGRDSDGLYEDRISIMIDDGSVGAFAETGGMVTVHPGMRSTATAADPDEVRRHPHLGERLGRSDVRKFILESRTGAYGPDSWESVRSLEELEALQEEGVFLDLWQWRAHRSNPIGYADNGYVLDYRHSSSGRSMFTTNQDGETGLPLKMFDPEKAGSPALRLEALRAREYGQGDPYFLTEDSGVPFDPDYDWNDGDAIPQRLLRKPDGSRGAIRAHGEYRDGAWHVRLTRSLDAPDPLDSKALVPGEIYHVAFAVHSGAGAGFHRVSLPMTLGLGVESDLEAREVEGDLDDAEVEWTEVTIFYLGDPTAG